MNSTLRIAIVGAGRITEDSHLPAVLSSPDVRLVALVDSDPLRARKLADRYRINPAIVTDVSAVVGDLDAAVIATPNHVHRDVAIACLRARVHCLIEKPLAVTARQGEEIAAEAESRGLVAAVGYSTRFFVSVQLLGELLEQNFFGAVRRFSYQFGSRGGWSPASGYILDRGATGGGVAVVSGTHFLDRMLAWFGYPTHIEYADDSLAGPEANCRAALKFDYRGAKLSGTVRLSKTIALPPGLVLETEKGTVVFADRLSDAEIVLKPAQPPACEMVLRRSSPQSSPGAPGLNPQSSVPGYHFARQLADFVAACRGQKPPMVTARQGTESLRLLEAMYACRTPLREFVPLRSEGAAV